MPNWSSHLPRAGALVLSAAVAAAAYSVYAGQASSPVTRAGEPVAGLSKPSDQGSLGLDAGSAGSPVKPKAKKGARPATRERKSALSRSAAEPATPTFPALAPLPTGGDDYVRVVTNPPTESGRPPKQPGDGDVIDRDLGPDDETLDRELQQLIDQGLPTDPQTGEEPTDPAPGPEIEPDPATEPQPEPAPDPEAGDEPEPAPSPEAGDEPQPDPAPVPPSGDEPQTDPAPDLETGDEPQAEAPGGPAPTSASQAPCAPAQPDDSLSG